MHNPTPFVLRFYGASERGFDWGRIGLLECFKYEAMIGTSKHDWPQYSPFSRLQRETERENQVERLIRLVIPTSAG